MKKLLPSCLGAKWIIINRACNGGRLKFLQSLSTPLERAAQGYVCEHTYDSLSEMHILQQAHNWKEDELWKIVED